MSQAPMRIRRFIIRTVLILLLIVLGMAMYNIGREYSVLLDNGTVTIDGREYPVIAYGSLIIDGDERKAIDIWEDDRLLQKLVGTSHTLRVLVLDEDDDSAQKTAERKIEMDFDTREWMISLAAIAGESERILIPNPIYIGEQETAPLDDEIQDDADGIPEF
ncbi:MAG: hypothetical protein LBI74_01225 [Synergistaceae bacterium]|nr:hypothetical protein [Synergistaceae bacterium]